jgi:hypothetical protein
LDDYVAGMDDHMTTLGRQQRSQRAEQVNQSNVYIKPILHQPMSQCAIQKPSLKPQTASNADVGSTAARKNSRERPKPRKKPREEPGYEGWPVLFWLCREKIITVHDQDSNVHR